MKHNRDEYDDRIFEYIKRRHDARDLPPTIREIGAEFGLAPSRVHGAVIRLIEQRRVKRDPKRPRSLRPVEPRVSKAPIIGELRPDRPIPLPNRRRRW